MKQYVSIVMGMRASLPIEQAGPLRIRLLKAASEMRQLTGDDGVEADHTNMVEFVELLEQFATVMRRAKASAHNRTGDPADSEEDDAR